MKKELGELSFEHVQIDKDFGNQAAQEEFQTELQKRMLKEFVSQHVVPQLGGRVSIGLFAKKGEYGAKHVWLSLLWPCEFRLGLLSHSKKMNELNAAFAKTVALSAIQEVEFHIEFISPRYASPAHFPKLLEERCKDENLFYLGMLRYH